MSDQPTRDHGPAQRTRRRTVLLVAAVTLALGACWLAPELRQLAGLAHGWPLVPDAAPEDDAPAAAALARPAPLVALQVLRDRLTVAQQPGLAGWKATGTAELAVVTNASDQARYVPARVAPHAVALHPAVAEFVAIVWKCPCAGLVRSVARVVHAHPVCGNGIAWWLEHRRGDRVTLLAEGTLDLGGAQSCGPLDWTVEPDDLLVLAIDARDGHVACDLTELAWTLVERSAPGRRWDLAADIADDIHAGNPHADRHGHPGVWSFVKGLSRPPGDANEVWQLALAPDGNTLAIACGSVKTGRPGEVKLCDLATRQVRTLFRDREPVRGVAFAPDGQTLAAGSFNQSIYLFDVASGTLQARLHGHTGGVNGLAFAPDGKLLASAALDHTVRLWDLPEGKLSATLSLHRNWVTSVAFAADGKSLASASHDGTANLWDVRTRRLLHTLTTHRGRVETIAFAPDSGTVATGSWDRTVKLWDAADGRERATLGGHANVVNAIAFAPDGRTLATASADTIKLWDLATHAELARLRGHRGAVWSLLFTADGKTLISGGWDQTVRLWDLATHKHHVLLGP